MPSIDFEGDELEAHAVMDVDSGQLVQPFVLDRSRARSLAGRHHRRTGHRVRVYRYRWDQRWDESRFSATVARYPVTVRRPRRSAA